MYNEKLYNAYEDTVAGAAKEGKSDFVCAVLLCDECPFKMYIGHCTDETVDGAGRKRTVAEWQEWWYALTGERDTRSEEDILKGSTVTEEEFTDDTTGEDTLQPKVSAPTVDIVWTTATGAVIKHRAAPIALLDGDMRQFSRELGVWISQLSKPDTCNNIADSIKFVARDSTGAVLANVKLFAELFGKSKVWKSICRD